MNDLIEYQFPDSEIATQVSEFIRAAHSDSTRKAYRSDLKQFLRWGGSVPSSPEMVASYISFYASTRKPATLARWLVSIGKAHTTKGLTDPTNNDLVRAVSRGIRRSCPCRQLQATPAVKEDIIAMVNTMGDRLKDQRDRALLLLGFAGASRRSELVGLNVGDIQEVREGLTVTIQRSKTDQEGRGRKVGIPFARGRACPVRALQDYLEESGISEGPIFRSITRHGELGGRLSGNAVSLIIKARAEAAGLDPTNYSGHSLRAGLATSAAAAGIPSYKVRQQTGHKNDAMLQRYIRDSQIFTDNAAGIL